MTTYAKKSIAQGMATKLTKKTGVQYEAVAQDDVWAVAPVKVSGSKRPAKVPALMFSAENRKEMLRQAVNFLTENSEFDRNSDILARFSEEELDAFMGKNTTSLRGAVMNIRYFGKQAIAA